MMQDKITRLRELMSEALPRPALKSPVEDDAWRAFQLYDVNAHAPEPEQTWRAQCIRGINRISLMYGWSGEIQHYLDTVSQSGLSKLTEAQIEALLNHLQHLESCLLYGGESPYAPPAR